MKTAKKKWAYRFLFAPADQQALAFLVNRREQLLGDGLELAATAVARQAVALFAKRLPDVESVPSIKIKTAQAKPWSLMLSREDIAHLDRVKKYYSLRFRNETLCFILRQQARAEGWKAP